MPTLKATPGPGDLDWLALAKHFLSCGPGPEPTLFPRRSVFTTALPTGIFRCHFAMGAEAQGGQGPAPGH